MEERIRRALSKQIVQTWRLLDREEDEAGDPELCTSRLRNGWTQMNVERLQDLAEEEAEVEEAEVLLDHAERAELELAAAFEARRELLARQRAEEERARADLMRDQFLAGQEEWWKVEDGAFGPPAAEPEDDSPHAEPPVEAAALASPFGNAGADDNEVAGTTSAAGGAAAAIADAAAAGADTPTPTTPSTPSTPSEPSDATDTASEASTSSEVTIDSISRAELASRLQACLVEGIVINRFNEVTQPVHYTCTTLARGCSKSSQLCTPPDGSLVDSAYSSTYV